MKEFELGIDSISNLFNINIPIKFSEYIIDGFINKKIIWIRFNWLNFGIEIILKPFKISFLKLKE